MAPASPVVVAVDIAVPPEAAFRYLVDPRNRAAWQSSLRRVDDVRGDGSLGTTWTDVMTVGVRAQMAVTVCEPFRVWAERGTWRGFVMDLTLRFRSVGSTGGATRLEATLALWTPGLLRPLGMGFGLVGPPAVRADLKRAARLVEASAPP